MKQILNYKREVSPKTLKRQMKEWEEDFDFENFRTINFETQYFNASDATVNKINKASDTVMPTIEGIWVRTAEGFYGLIIKCPFCGKYHKHCQDAAVLFYNLKTNKMTNIVRVSHCFRFKMGDYRIQANPNVIKCIPTKTYFELDL